MGLASPRPAPEIFPLTGAAAPALEMLPGGLPATASAPPENLNYQPSLFRDAAHSPKVIPIPMLTPARNVKREEAAPSAKQRRQVAGHSDVRQSEIKRNIGARTPRGRSDSQQSLDFHNAGTAHGLGMKVEVIYCDAPVALPAHRMLAAAFDVSMILLSVGLFLGIFLIAGGVLAFRAQNAPFFLGVAAILALFYRLLFYIADGDTPGMRFAGLRLVDFDGRKPDREQRGMRQIAGILSLFSAGLGLVWALVDEESLTWHDHISKTFPTAG
jgi:uncharacterized RDD family membrane protein YckC